jgi:hypothetical protein
MGPRAAEEGLGNCAGSYRTRTYRHNLVMEAIASTASVTTEHASQMKIQPANGQTSCATTSASWFGNHPLPRMCMTAVEERLMDGAVMNVDHPSAKTSRVIERGAKSASHRSLCFGSAGPIDDDVSYRNLHLVPAWLCVVDCWREVGFHQQASFNM